MRARLEGSAKALGLDLSGALTFDGKVKGNIEKFSETLRAEGTVLGRKMGFRKWAAEQVRMDGVYTSAAKGGEISITKAEISSLTAELRWLARHPRANSAQAFSRDGSDRRKGFVLRHFGKLDEKELAVPTVE